MGKVKGKKVLAGPHVNFPAIYTSVAYFPLFSRCRRHILSRYNLTLLRKRSNWSPPRNMLRCWVSPFSGGFAQTPPSAHAWHGCTAPSGRSLVCIYLALDGPPWQMHMSPLRSFFILNTLPYPPLILPSLNNALIGSSNKTNGETPSTRPLFAPDCPMNLPSRLHVWAASTSRTSDPLSRLGGRVFSSTPFLMVILFRYRWITLYLKPVALHPHGMQRPSIYSQRPLTSVFSSPLAPCGIPTHTIPSAAYTSSHSLGPGLSAFFISFLTPGGGTSLPRTHSNTRSQIRSPYMHVLTITFCPGPFSFTPSSRLPTG